MSEEKGKDPRGDSEGNDTDEIFEDHPEMAPDESRISVGKVKDLEGERRRRSEAGDAVEDAGDTHHKTDLYFARNQDFAGNEMGSPPQETRAPGFDPSSTQDRNKEAIREDAVGEAEDWTARPLDEDSEISQGRDVSHPEQATGVQRYGREIGGSGLSQEDREDRIFVRGNPAAQAPEHKVWASILRRLGGGSPGSEENMQLAELFSKVQFPADKTAVISRIDHGAELRLREGIVVDLHQAVDHSRMQIFQNMGDLVDSVKDELRRQEADGKRLLKTV